MVSPGQPWETQDPVPKTQKKTFFFFFWPHLSSFFLLCCMQAEGKWPHLSQKAAFPVLTRNDRETEQSYLISAQTIRILVMMSPQNLSEIGWLN